MQQVYTPANQRSPVMEYERRQSTRFPLAAAAEIIDVRTNSHLNALTLDLSVVSCHVDVPSFFPVGTQVRVHIVHNEQMFTAFEAVAHGHPRTGMGIRFTEIAPDQREILEKWIATEM